tara:strand:+ start:2735 stop:4918 length:2184 start_codon:yes stop_codon:yes gene_type:complete
MSSTLNLNRLKTSWTKYDAVQVIDVVSSLEEIKNYIEKKKEIDEPSLRNFLGINKLTDPIPEYWSKIQNYPEQKRLFALVAAIFTHHDNIMDFAIKYSTGDMKGVFKMQPGKQFTNIRSALVESGAAPNSLRRKDEVEYDLTPLYEQGEVGILFKMLLEDRLRRASWDGDDFLKTCIDNNLHKAISLSSKEFELWTSGKNLVESKLKYNLRTLEKYKEFKAFKVNQWLKDWDDIDFSSEEMRSKPQPFYLMFKMDARLLKRLSDVHRRKSDKSAVQRTHNVTRSEEINSYIHGGFPWSTISQSQRESHEYRDLKMPGMLPAAVIANILGPEAERGKNKLEDINRIRLQDADSDFPTIELPESVFDESWDPSLKPLEIIDGQHRLWAFDEKEAFDGNYELPVIAYYDLDRAWQAYLFYTINIKPVKINTSLGYDLYPLLRTQKWLESSKEGLIFYRENRAQELVEALWTYKASPWRNRIKMLGEGEGNISQAAFIRALTSSFLRKSVERTSWGMGGLFSDIIKHGSKIQVINWNRSQQAGFIILMWSLIKDNLDSFLEKDYQKQEPVWAKEVRENEETKSTSQLDHPGFYSKNSFLSRDQGVRGISMLANDIFFVIAKSDNWDLNELGWEGELDDKSIRSESIDKSINQIRKHKIYSVMQSFSDEVVKFDWRTPSSVFAEDESQRLIQNQYKGGSGYNAVWKALIEVFSKTTDEILKPYVLEVKELVK